MEVPPILLPAVSGRFHVEYAVARLMASSTGPITRKDVDSVTRYGLMEPATRAIALLAAWPVARISVVKISAVDTHVAHVDPIMGKVAKW